VGAHAAGAGPVGAHSLARWLACHLRGSEERRPVTVTGNSGGDSGGRTGPPGGRLLAISDLHVHYPQNRAFVESLPASPDDWLIVAGDVAELFAEVEWALRVLVRRFGTVIWTPGNHELWAHPADPVKLRGDYRYRRLVLLCRELGVHTPEDPFPVWRGPGGPAAVAPLFVLYDYTFLPEPATSQREALEQAYRVGVVCTDEAYLHPDPFPSREAWCAARLAYTQRRLAGCELPTVLASHFPLIREPTRVLRYPEFAQWCGTVHTADWHLRYHPAAVVYGHLHIPRTTYHDGVRFEEVSLGYPREWEPRSSPPALRQILPAADGPPAGSALPHPDS
jgi:3',5'-cyclic AMP phosphodiesterase CpdA